MTTIYCKVCGKPFDVKPYRAKEAKYCSAECYHKTMFGGEPANKGVYTRRITLVCSYCGKMFEREEGRLKHGRGKHCSLACMYADIKSRDPRASMTERICLNCAKVFNIYTTRLSTDKNAGKYCSRVCRDEHRKGINHPQYIGGEPDNRGPNWQAQRRKALKRDNHTCQHCGKPGEDVHHIKPFRFFGIDDYKTANQILNLITLCRACHRIADAEIQHS